MAVALETHPHVEPALLAGQREPGDVAMADGTCDPVRHVDAMVEKDEIRQAGHPRPNQTLSASGTVDERTKQGCIAKDLRMAAQARLRGGHPGKGGPVSRGVTVSAVYAEQPRVVPMAERDRLVGSQSLTCPPRGMVVGEDGASAPGDEQRRQQEDQPEVARSSRTKQRATVPNGAMDPPLRVPFPHRRRGGCRGTNSGAHAGERAEAKRGL